MILTDKCKEEFLDYYATSTAYYLLCNKEFDELPLIMQYALIIEFFDSVGILILPHYSAFGFYSEIKDYNDKSFGEFKTYLVCDYKIRTEATQSAITKANEIFNNLNK